MSRFAPSRIYLVASSISLGLAAFSGWCAWNWTPAWIATSLFTLCGLGLLLLAFRPVIEIHDGALWIGNRKIEWGRIRRVDRTGWVSPLVVDLTLADESRVRVVYPGDVKESERLFRMLQQHSTQALIDGVAQQQLWPSESVATTQVEPPEATTIETPAVPRQTPKYRLLTEEDEAEVERLYHKLRTAGRLDPEK